MVKEIINIHINSASTSENSATKEYITDGTNLYSIILEVPPIIIKNRANLKVANICHCTTNNNTSHTNKIFIFKIEGVQMDYSKYITNDGGIPTILATTFDSTRNLYEENDIPLIRQTINSIKLNLLTLNGNTINGFSGYYSITSGGSGYLTGQILTFSLDNLDVIASITASSGAITSLNTISDRSNWTLFTSAPTLQTSINGSGAILTPIMNGSSINDINIVNGGIGYVVGQTLTITGAGAGGAVITISNVDATGKIVPPGCTISNGGSYTGTPSLSVNARTITQTATISPLMNYGVISSGISNTLNFCISLKIEEEINE